MKTRVWKRLTWDLKIVYNRHLDEYYLQKYDYSWQTIEAKKTMKLILQEKHSIIKQRIKERGLFNENI